MTHPPSSEATALFRKHFRETPGHVVQAPARLELLGNHTDYNEGLVLSIAIDKYLHIASSPRTNGIVEVVSSARKQPVRFSIDRIEPDAAAAWAGYVKGVLKCLRERGVRFNGLNLAIHSSIPE